MTIFFDFTLPIYNNMGGIPSGGRADVFPRPDVKIINTIEREGWLAEELTIMTHAGTHVDYPAHMIKNGDTLDNFLLDDCIGKGVVLNIPKGELEGITDADLEVAEPRVEEGDIVFINTGWWPKWEPYEKETNDYITWKHPGIVYSGAQWLVEKKVKAVGIDANAIHVHGTSNESDPKESVHYAFLSRRIMIVETLTNLGPAAGKRGRIYIIPLPIKGAGGTLTRVFMEVDQQV
jgi:kynurenine formamidase